MYPRITTMKHSAVLLFSVLGILGRTSVAQTDVHLYLSTQDVTVIVDEVAPFQLHLDGNIRSNHEITFTPQHKEMIEILPSPVLRLAAGLITGNVSFQILGKHPGYLDILTSVSPANGELSVANLFLRVTVAMSTPLIYVSIVVGWIYFVAWSVSFYPQIVINYQRKSVVGLNFDFLALNIVGFAMYGIFNMALFWDANIQSEYFARNPRGLNPVLVNDVVFAVHAALATAVTIGQCFMYERGDQRVSTTARSILGIFGVAIVVFGILVATDVIHWLDFLYYCSYIKLTITLIKYIPQAVMNYRRKSTVGWSIGNIFLDFTGGMLSMLQMILNAYNYDDWASIFGDPTKFGLGLFSVVFDIFFMVQHYVLYRHPAASSDVEEAKQPPKPTVATISK